MHECHGQHVCRLDKFAFATDKVTGDVSHTGILHKVLDKLWPIVKSLQLQRHKEEASRCISCTQNRWQVEGGVKPRNNQHLPKQAQGQTATVSVAFMMAVQQSKNIHKKAVLIAVLGCTGHLCGDRGAYR